MAGIFFYQTARDLLARGHMTPLCFPPLLSLRTTLQKSMTLDGNSSRTSEGYLRAEIYFEL